jgi:hypothetical protein
MFIYKECIDYYISEGMEQMESIPAQMQIASLASLSYRSYFYFFWYLAA